MNTQTEVIYHAQEDYAKSTAATNTAIATTGSLAVSYRNWANQQQQQSTVQPKQNENYTDPAA